MVATERDLIAQIAEDPASDGPRLALADFYAVHEDPRGELMSIQLARHPLGAHKTRLAKLLRAHGARMVGSLVDILDVNSLKFERGRLVSCRTAFRDGHQRGTTRGNPLWATVEELDTDDPFLVADEAMRSLRTVRGLRVGAFALLCRTSRPLPLETVEIHGHLALGGPDERAAIAHSRVLPQLRRLRFVITDSEPITAERLRWILASPLGQQLDEFAIQASATSPIDRASFMEFSRWCARPLRFDFGDEPVVDQ